MSKKEKNQSNPLFIVIVFMLIIAAFVALPYIKSKKEKPIIIPSNSNKDIIIEKISDEQDAMSEYLKIGEKGETSFNKLKISNPTYDNNQITLTIYSEKDTDLGDLDYYIEFYKDKKEFLFRRSLNGLISSKSSVTITLDKIDITDDVYIAISHIREDAIPKIKLATDESGISGVRCTKDNLTYEYDFNSDGLLRVVKKYSYKDSNLDNFSNKLFEAQKEANKLNEQKGITASVVESNKEFIYTIELNYLEKIDNSIDPFFYSKGEQGNIIIFKMNAEGFECL